MRLLFREKPSSVYVRIKPALSRQLQIADYSSKLIMVLKAGHETFQPPNTITQPSIPSCNLKLSDCLSPPL